MNQSETLLEIKDLCVEFKTMAGTVHAVDHLSYTLHRGEKLGIVGESGSGKSVSSLAMMQLIPNPPGKVTGGQIYVYSDGMADAALDYDGTATITAGTVIAVGNSGMAQNFGTNSTQGSILVNFNRMDP